MDSPEVPSARRNGARRQPAAERRHAILEATLRLSAQNGLANVATSAISREVGIAAGTLFIYFETKEALINALYLELLERRYAVVTAGLDETTNDRFKTLWYNYARWYLDQPEVSNVIQQCEVSFALTPESHARRAELDQALRGRYFPESFALQAMPLHLQVKHALMMGPLVALGQLRDKGELVITDDVLDETYRRVRRAMQD